MVSSNGAPHSTSASDRPSKPSRQTVGQVVLALLISIATGGVLATQTLTLDRILAVVGGNVIMLSDVRAFIDLGLADVSGAPESEVATLTLLIERRLALDEIDRYVVADPLSQTINLRLDEVRDRFATTQTFTTVLDRVGFTEADLRAVLRDNARRDAYLEERFFADVQLTEAKLRSYHETHSAEFLRDGQMLIFEEARPEVRRQLTKELHAKMVAEWTATLVERGQVIRVPAITGFR